jgi:imidazolonepropionase-like amidohydrolase
VHLHIAREFKCLVDYGGMSPYDALLAGTASAADLLQLPIGRICVGKCADLVAVRGNPVLDISVLEREVVWVMKGGKVVRNDL